jgi:hypothetical protein
MKLYAAIGSNQQHGHTRNRGDRCRSLTEIRLAYTLTAAAASGQAVKALYAPWFLRGSNKTTKTIRQLSCHL